MSGFWPIFFLLVVLKIPVFSALGLIWWAIREPDPETDASEDSGDGFNRWRASPRPRGPHSGPFGGVARPGFRTRPAELVSDRRKRVPQDGCGTPAPAHTRQAG